MSEEPDYPPPQPPKRPWYKRTWKWYRTRSRRTQIAIAAVIVLFIAFSGLVASVTPAAPSQDSNEFSADNFTDASQNPVKPGLFDANYLYASDTSHIDSCNIALGTQQTQ